MRAPPWLVVLSVIGLAAGCSRPKAPVHTQDLDLMLPDAGRNAPVASALEIAGEVKSPPAAPSHRLAATSHRTRHAARTPAPRAAPAKARAADPLPRLASATAPAPVPVPVSAAPQPTAPRPAAPDPAAGAGNGGGWSAHPTDGGGRFPGMPGGVIVIRGGHSGRDPCDEHGRGVLGGILHGITGRGGGGRFPGGIVF